MNTAHVPATSFDPGTTLGPRTAAARDRVRGYIRSGLEEGEHMLTGGPDAPQGLNRGYYVRPTIFRVTTPAVSRARSLAPSSSSFFDDSGRRPHRQRSALWPRRRRLRRRERARSIAT